MSVGFDRARKRSEAIDGAEVLGAVHRDDSVNRSRTGARHPYSCKPVGKVTRLSKTLFSVDEKQPVVSAGF